MSCHQLTPLLLLVLVVWMSTPIEAQPSGCSNPEIDMLLNSSAPNGELPFFLSENHLISGMPALRYTGGPLVVECWIKVTFRGQISCQLDDPARPFRGFITYGPDGSSQAKVTCAKDENCQIRQGASLFDTSNMPTMDYYQVLLPSISLRYVIRITATINPSDQDYLAPEDVPYRCGYINGDFREFKRKTLINPHVNESPDMELILSVPLQVEAGEHVPISCQLQTPTPWIPYRNLMLLLEHVNGSTEVLTSCFRNCFDIDTRLDTTKNIHGAKVLCYSQWGIHKKSEVIKMIGYGTPRRGPHLFVKQRKKSLTISGSSLLDLTGESYPADLVYEWRIWNRGTDQAPLVVNSDSIQVQGLPPLVPKIYGACTLYHSQIANSELVIPIEITNTECEIAYPRSWYDSNNIDQQKGLRFSDEFNDQIRFTPTEYNNKAYQYRLLFSVIATILGILVLTTVILAIIRRASKGFRPAGKVIAQAGPDKKEDGDKLHAKVAAVTALPDGTIVMSVTPQRKGDGPVKGLTEQVVEAQRVVRRSVIAADKGGRRRSSVVGQRKQSSIVGGVPAEIQPVDVQTAIETTKLALQAQSVTEAAQAAAE